MVWKHHLFQRILISFQQKVLRENQNLNLSIHKQQNNYKKYFVVHLPKVISAFSVTQYSLKRNTGTFLYFIAPIKAGLYYTFSSSNKNFYTSLKWVPKVFSLASRIIVFELQTAIPFTLMFTYDLMRFTFPRNCETNFKLNSSSGNEFNLNIKRSNFFDGRKRVVQFWKSNNFYFRHLCRTILLFAKKEIKPGSNPLR